MSPNPVVVDASIVVKWFIEEKDTGLALNLRDKHIDNSLALCAPDLIIYEVMNALYYSKLFNASELREIAEALIAYSINTAPPTGELMKTAVEVASEGNLTIYDSSYVALAMVLQAVLVTEDKTILQLSQTKDRFSSTRSLQEFSKPF